MMTPDGAKQKPLELLRREKREKDPLMSTCTGQLSALIKGTEFFSLLRVLRATATEVGVSRAVAALPGKRP